MTIDDQVTELRRVAFALAAMSDLLPADTRLRVAVAEPDGTTEVDFHGCTPDMLRAIPTLFDSTEMHNDAYGNPKYVTVQDDALELTFYLA